MSFLQRLTDKEKVEYFKLQQLYDVQMKTYKELQQRKNHSLN
jgi:hypothetical protein